jgi:hypothetical protein
METRMRAKFKVESVTKFEGQENLKLSAVCANSFGPNGESEDNDFARYTPSGDLQMTVNNPDLLGKINPGEKYYLDFTKAD